MKGERIELAKPKEIRSAGRAFQALGALPSSAVLDNVSMISQTIVGTISVPAKRIR
jgi:hypothetical protein